MGTPVYIYSMSAIMYSLGHCTLHMPIKVTVLIYGIRLDD